jgi:hypothetical protein
LRTRCWREHLDPRKEVKRRIEKIHNKEIHIFNNKLLGTAIYVNEYVNTAKCTHY